MVSIGTTAFCIVMFLRQIDSARCGKGPLITYAPRRVGGW